MTAKKLLFLGDSFTVGTGLGEGKEHEAFPFQLVEELGKNGTEFKEPEMFAVDGHTTKHLLGSLDASKPTSNPEDPNHAPEDYDMVVVSIGVNDLFRGHTTADYNHHLSEIFDRAVRFAGDDPSKVIVVSTPAWDASPSVFNKGGTDFRHGKYAQVRHFQNEISVPVSALIRQPDNSYKVEMSVEEIEARLDRAKKFNTQEGIASLINEFNDTAKARAQERKISFLDITDLTRRKATTKDGAPDPAMFADDGIHYSGAMYKKWVDLILPLAKNSLKLER